MSARDDERNSEIDDMHPGNDNHRRSRLAGFALTVVAIVAIGGATAIAAGGLLNGSFEQGLDNWTVSTGEHAARGETGDTNRTVVYGAGGSVSPDVPCDDTAYGVCVIDGDSFDVVDGNGQRTIDVDPLDGGKMLRLAGPFGNNNVLQETHDFRVEQSFTVDAANPVLNLNYDLFSYDSQAYDRLDFVVKLTTPSGSVLVDDARGPSGRSHNLKTTGWRSNDIDLSEYAGQQVTLQVALSAARDELFGSWAYIDAGISPEPDKTPPTTSITSGPAKDSTIGTNTTSFGFSSEPGATFQCKLDAGAFAACTSPTSVGPMGEGTHTFSVRATDSSGNVESPPASRPFRVDTTAPPVSITSGPANGSTIATNTTAFGFSSESGASFQCKLDAGAFAACTSPKSVGPMGDGSHTFSVRATDAAGHVSTPASRTFHVDATAPETTITSGPANGSTVTAASASFGFSSNKAGAGFECKLDGAAFSACTSPKSVGPLAIGAHTFSVRAKGSGGVVDATPASRTFTVDRTAPSTSITSAPKTPLKVKKSATVSVGFGADDPKASFECSLDGAAFSACVSPQKLTLGKGTHTFSVRARDAAGNLDATPATVKIEVKLKKKGGHKGGK